MDMNMNKLVGIFIESVVAQYTRDLHRRRWQRRFESQVAQGTAQPVNIGSGHEQIDITRAHCPAMTLPMALPLAISHFSFPQHLPQFLYKGHEGRKLPGNVTARGWCVVA